ncbi:MAG: ABC transporter substrate-binding protein [Planctomycetaceae bacterium]
MRRFLLALLLLAACGGERKGAPGEAGAFDPESLPYGVPAAAEPVRGGTFTWGRPSDASSLDPAVITDGESVMVTVNLFDTLVAYEPDRMELLPALAESWEASADGLVWTFRLRDGVQFHDGTACDAAAVVFSFLRQKDAGHPAHVGAFAYYEDNFKALDRVEAADARTVRFTLAHPYAPFLGNLALFSAAIVSPTAWASEGMDAQGKFRYAFGQKPVGTGPFVFEEWHRGERIVLRANGKHFRGRPHLDRLVFRPIKNPQARLQELEAGGVQGIYNPDLVDVASAARDPRLAVLSRPGLNVAYLAMNNTKPPFDKVGVRRAVALAIDKKRILEAAYNGMARVAETMCPEGIPGHLALPASKPDPARARGLLAEAGFPDGFSTELWYGTATRPYMPDPEGVAIQVQQDLRAIGIEAKLRKVEWGAYIPATQRGDHPMCLLGWMADLYDADNFLYVLLDMDNARPGSANNISFYTGERFHDLVTRAQREMDPVRRVELYHEAQRVAQEDAPVVPLAQVRDFRILAAGIRGFTIYPVGGEYFRSVSLPK